MPCRLMVVIRKKLRNKNLSAKVFKSDSFTSLRWRKSDLKSENSNLTVCVAEHRWGKLKVRGAVATLTV